ncbi:hypothetical protein K438DRAFT_1768230 [Mycena galopus ATCC 62051]|nr:hypothetical protein K438DRAFT_1768230 [Mycena galopus ATCC 62051]
MGRRGREEGVEGATRRNDRDREVYIRRKKQRLTGRATRIVISVDSRDARRMEHRGTKKRIREESGEENGRDGEERRWRRGIGEDNGEGSDETATYQQHAPAPRRTWTATPPARWSWAAAEKGIRRCSATWCQHGRRRRRHKILWEGNIRAGIEEELIAVQNDRYSQPGVKGSARKNGVGGAGGDVTSVVPIAEEENVYLGLAARRGT